MKRLCCACACVSTALLAAFTSMPVPLTDAPLSRVIPNLEARIKENPEDAEARYSLGRAHTMAYVTKRDMVRGYGTENNFQPLPINIRDNEFDPRVPGDLLPAAELPRHLRSALQRLVEAIRLKRAPEHYLALAALLETAGDACMDLDAESVLPQNPWGEPVQILPNGEDPGEDSYVLALPREDAERVVRARIFQGTLDPAQYTGACDEQTVRSLVTRADDPDQRVRAAAASILKDFWFEQTRDAYFIAFSLALAQEAKFDDRPMGTLGLRMTVEAGNGFLRVSKARPDRTEDPARTKIVEAAVEALGKQQQNGGITPIIFGLDHAKPLADLLQPDAVVGFKLNGTDLPQRWPWLKPDTGILVWDPSRTGHITSGRQLFGSVTWWLMFGDGYDALDALDDNRDGRLTRGELTGLAVWRDRNSDGVSNSEEVVPVERLGITGIGTRASSRDGVSPLCREGLSLADGRVLPTYDWVTGPAVRSPSTSVQTVAVR